MQVRLCFSFYIYIFLKWILFLTPRSRKVLKQYFTKAGILENSGELSEQVN